MYTEKVMDHFKNPRNVGEIKGADAKSTEGSLACGDMVTMYLKIDEKTHVIKDIKFKSFGCASNIATCSALTEIVKGKTIEEAKNVKFEEISKYLGVLPKIKMHCAVLATVTLQSAIKNYQEKHGLIDVKEEANEENQILGQFERAPSPVHRLLLLFDHWYELYGHHTQIGRLVLECWTSAARETQVSDDKGPMASMLNELYAKWREAISGIVVEGQAAGEFRAELEPTMAASVVMGVLDGLTLQGILGVGVSVGVEFLLRLKRGFLIVLGADTGILNGQVLQSIDGDDHE